MISQTRCLKIKKKPPKNHLKIFFKITTPPQNNDNLLNDIRFSSSNDAFYNRHSDSGEKLF